jgi:sigma-B regulation protein RsbU (phosphoserine phosphatase)
MGFIRYPKLDPPRRLALAPGDLLGLLSDGVFETENAAGEQFGTAGVERVVARCRHRPMAELLATLLEELRAYAGGVPQGDDVTVVLLRRREEEPAATTFERYFRRDFASLEQIFLFVEEFLRAQAIDAGLLEPVNFIVEELFTNMVKYNPGNTRDIALSLGRTADVLTVRLTDFDVDPFDVTRAPPVDIEKPLAERQIGGLGLHLVRRMADTLRYESVDRRSTITFTKSLR